MGMRKSGSKWYMELERFGVGSDPSCPKEVYSWLLQHVEPRPADCKPACLLVLILT